MSSVHTLMWLHCSNEQNQVVSELFKIKGQNPTWRSLGTASGWPSTREPTKNSCPRWSQKQVTFSNYQLKLHLCTRAVPTSSNKNKHKNNNKCQCIYFLRDLSIKISKRWAWKNHREKKKQAVKNRKRGGKAE